MIYGPGMFGFDVETVRLNPRNESGILQLALTFDEPGSLGSTPVWELPKYVRFIDPGTIKDGDVVAMMMNHWVMVEIDKHRKNQPTLYPVVSIDEAMDGAIAFIQQWSSNLKYKPYVVGQNVGTFDLAFAPRLVPHFNYRTWEIGSTFANKTGPVSLERAKEACGYPKTVRHDAWYECMDYHLCLRTKIFGGNTTYYPG